LQKRRRRQFFTSAECAALCVTTGKCEREANMWSRERADFASSVRSDSAVRTVRRLGIRATRLKQAAAPGRTLRVVHAGFVHDARMQLGDTGKWCTSGAGMSAAQCKSITAPLSRGIRTPLPIDR